jgi:CO/xanthine dehydrogenase Mo-binding subunit
MKKIVYNQDGHHLSTGTSTDDCMPRADDIPPSSLPKLETNVTTDPLGTEGFGEAITIPTTRRALRAAPQKGALS